MQGKSLQVSLCWEMRYWCRRILESIPRLFWSISSFSGDDVLLVHPADQDSDASVAPLSSFAVTICPDFSSSKARSNHAAYSRSADTQSTSAADSLLSSRAQMDHAAGLRTATNGIFIRAAGSRTASNGISTGAADFLTSSSTSSKRRHDLGGACVERPCQNIFVDLGASTWNTGLGGPSQSWFYDSYKRHGLEFDRLLLWEAEPTPASAVFSSLPKELWHKYQYFNWPASSNSSDPSSPLRIIKKIAQPGDFVVLKLDIDTPKVEMAILRELLNDPDLLELVDEFFFFLPLSFFTQRASRPPPRRRPRSRASRFPRERGPG